MQTPLTPKTVKRQRRKACCCCGAWWTIATMVILVTVLSIDAWHHYSEFRMENEKLVAEGKVAWDDCQKLTSGGRRFRTECDKADHDRHIPIHRHSMHEAVNAVTAHFGFLAICGEATVCRSVIELFTNSVGVFRGPIIFAVVVACVLTMSLVVGPCVNLYVARQQSNDLKQLLATTTKDALEQRMRTSECASSLLLVKPAATPFMIGSDKSD